MKRIKLKIISANKIDAVNIIKLLAAAAVIAVISRAFEHFDSLYYALIPLLVVTAVIALKNLKIDKDNFRFFILISLFPLWALITSLWSYYPALSFERSVFFLVIVSGTFYAGYLYTSVSEKFPINYFLPANVLMIALSVISLITGIPAEAWTGGNERGFMGFSVHQNTLASLLLLTIPVILLNIMRLEKPFSLKKFSYAKLSLWILLSLNILILILTHSRTSLLSLCIMVLIFILIYSEKKLKAAFLLLSALIFLTTITLLIKPVTTAAEDFLHKGYADVLGNRMILWLPSIEAAKEGGLTGLGYGVSHPEIFSKGAGSHYQGERYVREKGNSTLALIEETGIVGGMLFILPLMYFLILLARSIRNIKTGGVSAIINPVSGIRHPASGIRHPKKGQAVSPKGASGISQRGRRHPDFLAASLLIASLSAFIFHAQFEAWWVGPGSVQLPLFYFYVGTAAAKMIAGQSSRYSPSILQ